MTTDLAPLEADAAALIKHCSDRGVRIATAESCTGGLIAGLLTEISGSSEVVDRGFVTYSNAAKTDLLGVSPDLMAPGGPGAVSEEVARAMAEGAIHGSRADIAVAVTGIAGPNGGTAEKPVGLVHLAVANADGPTVHRKCEFGDIGRPGIRQATVREALGMLASAAKKD